VASRANIRSGSKEASRSGLSCPIPCPRTRLAALAGFLGRGHEAALLSCGRLDSIAEVLPDPELFLYACERREALVSSQIEGTQSSLLDLLVVELCVRGEAYS